MQLLRNDGAGASEFAAGALETLAARSDSLRAYFASVGGVRQLIDMLKHTSPSVTEMVANALASAATGEDEDKRLCPLSRAVFIAAMLL